MSSFLYAFQGWQNNGGAVAAYNNDTGIWSTPASDPNIAAGGSNSSLFTFKGAWDGNSWYIISPSGGLHAYNPTSVAWKTNLVSGTTIIQGTVVNNLQAAMASDGAFIYILTNTNDFRRYDPSLDTLTALATPPGSSYNVGIFLSYDGSGSIYGTKGGGGVIGKYNIASNSWSTLPSGPYTSAFGNNSPTWTAFLQGSLWMLVGATLASTISVYQYSPTSGTWTSGAVLSASSQLAGWPGGEDSDSTIRLWPSSVASQVYNINTNTWSAGATTPYAWAEGTNWCVTRVWSAAFSWFGSDGITALPPTDSLGSATLGQTLTLHAKVQTPVARAAGITVFVPVNTSTDAATAVTICNTANGTYGTSFSTGALAIGDEVDVFIKVIPTASQTLGLSKSLFLQIAPN